MEQPCDLKQAKRDLDGALADYNRALELKPDFAAARKNRDLVQQSKAKPVESIPTKTGTNRKSVPATENTLALRTNFSDEAAWKSLCAAIQDPAAEFTANVDFVSDPQFDGVTAEVLPALLAKDSTSSFAFIIDHIALTKPGHPILAVDLQTEPGRNFRVIASALWEVENNLSIANMSFEEFADAVDADGVCRGS